MVWNKTQFFFFLFGVVVISGGCDCKFEGCFFVWGCGLDNEGRKKQNEMGQKKKKEPWFTSLMFLSLKGFLLIFFQRCFFSSGCLLVVLEFQRLLLPTSSTKKLTSFLLLYNHYYTLCPVSNAVKNSFSSSFFSPLSQKNIGLGVPLFILPN